MSCKNCSELTHMEFETKTCIFKNCCELLVFLLNRILDAKSFDDDLCDCGNEKCLICKMNRTFNSHEYNLYQTMFDLNFLINCHSYLYYYCNERFKSKKHCLCFILTNKYHNVWKDWYNGKNYCVFLMLSVDAIKHKEEHDINKI